MRGGAFLKGKEGRVGFRKNTFFNGKEGRDDFRTPFFNGKEVWVRFRKKSFFLKRADNITQMIPPVALK